MNVKLTIIRKKASSLRELGQDVVEMKDVKTLHELLIEVSHYEFNQQNNQHQKQLNENDIHNLSNLGKVSFGVRYNLNQGNFEKAVQIMIQDYKDGLFRVFFNGRECLNLDENLEIQDENEVVFIRLIMMAGRLW